MQFAGVSATGANLRVPYCVCYDLDDSSILALRVYLPIARMVAEVQTAAQSVRTA
jgi:hypothetical protein